MRATDYAFRFMARAIGTRSKHAASQSRRQAEVKPARIGSARISAASSGGNEACSLVGFLPLCDMLPYRRKPTSGHDSHSIGSCCFLGQILKRQAILGFELGRFFSRAIAKGKNKAPEQTPQNVCAQACDNQHDGSGCHRVAGTAQGLPVATRQWPHLVQLEPA